MRYFSRFVAMGFEEALAATRKSLKDHQLAILAEIDLCGALKADIAVDLRPCIILGTCSLGCVQRAIEADSEIGSILLCNVVVQRLEDGRVEISAADPASTIGTVNHVELIWTARELRSVLRQAIGEVGSALQPRRNSPSREEAGRELLQAPSPVRTGKVRAG